MAVTRGNAEKRANRILLFSKGVQLCSKCGEVKPLEAFGKYKGDKLGYSCQCLSCLNEAAEAYRRKQGRVAGRTKRIAHQFFGGIEHKYCSTCDTWRSLDSFNKSKETWDRLTTPCKTCAAARTRKNQAENRERVNATTRAWRVKRERTPFLLLNQAISGGVWHALRGKKSGRRWETLVGYTVEDLKSHLESLFTEGMSWDNYGRLAGSYENSWEVDHVIPISHFSFISAEDEEFKQCWSLSNLQPKWARENRQKSNRYIG